MRTLLFGLLMLVALSSVVAQPVITVNGPLEFCYGESVVLCVEPDTYVAYIWNTGSTTRCATITQSGTYSPVVMDSLGNIDSSLVATPITVIVHQPYPQVIVSGYTCYTTESFETYQWYRNADLIEGATDSFYVATTPGNYWVMVTDEYGCSGSADVFESGPFPNGIEDEVIGSFVVFPNPFTSHIVVSVEQAGIASITLFDMMGREVYHQSTSDLSTTIDLSGVPEGVYLVAVEDAEGHRAVKRVVKVVGR